MLRTALIIDGNSDGGQRALAAMEGSIEQSEAASRKLAAAYSAVDISTTRLAQAQTTAKSQIDATKAAHAAGEIGMEQYNRELLETKTALGLVEAEHRKYVGELRNARVGMEGVTGASGQQRAGLQQLAMNVSDMTTMWSLGAKGSQIFASQMGQTMQAIQLLGGGAGKFSAFMANPWVQGITMGTMILAPLAAGLLDTDEATRKVEYSTSNLSDAQQILGDIYNINTGKAKAYTDATLALARAQAVSLQIEAQRSKMDAEKSMTALQKPTIKVGGGPGGLAVSNYLGPQADVISAFRDGTLKVNEAERGLRSLNRTGLLTDDMYEKAAKAVTDYGVAQDNIVRGDQLEKALGGDTAAMQGLLKVTAAHKPHVDRLAESLARQTAATEAQITGLYDLAAAYGKSDAEALKAQITGKATEQGILKRADLESYVSQQIRLAVAQRTADGAAEVAGLRAQTDARHKYNAQVSQGLITSEEELRLLQDDAALRPYLAAKLLVETAARADLAAAEKAEGAERQKLIDKAKAEQKAADDLASTIKNLTGERKRANDEEIRSRDLAARDKSDNDFGKMTVEIALEQQLGEARIAALKGLNGDSLEDTLAAINHQREISLIRINAEYEAAELEKQGLNEAAAAHLRLAEAQVKASDQAFDFDKQATSIERSNDQLREMISLLNNLGGLGSVLGGILGVASGNYDNLGGGQLGQLLSFVLNQKDNDGKKIGDDVKNSLDGLFKEVFGKDGLFGNTLSDVLQGAGVGVAASNAILGDQGTAGDIGAAIGGAAGKVLGTALLGPIGGAIGSVVGGLLGGAIGGLFASTPKGSATINGLGVTSTSGKGEQLDNSKKAASSILDSLDQIAEALGGTVGAVSGVSIGMRKDSWKLDPTGQGRTKGSGVIDFGDDAEAAAMAAMKLLIERGVIGGIRASTQNILSAGTDLQTQINKAVAWQGILDEAEHSSSSFASSLSDLKDQFDEIGKIAIEAKASTEELAEVQALLIRKQQELIDQAMASYRSTFYSDAENVSYAKQTISSKLTPLGYGSVDTVDEYKALVAATDALANPDLFGTLMDLSDEFGVLKDATDKAADAAAAAAEQEKALAQQRGQLEVDILRAQGRDAEAEAKDRQMRLAAADASLRPLLQDLFKAEDIGNARDALKDAFEKAKAPLEDTIDKMGKLVDSLKDVRAGLDDTADGAVSIAQAEAKLREVGYKANVLGDQDALGQLGGVINDFASAARKGAGSQLELDRLMAEARRYADAGIGSASAAKDIAQQQLDADTAAVGQLIDINENLLSVHDAILQLQQLQGGGSGAGSPTPAQQQDEDRNRQREIRDRLNEVGDRIQGWINEQDRFNRRFERMITDERLQVTVVAEPVA